MGEPKPQMTQTNSQPIGQPASAFANTLWADPDFSREYRENADHFIPARQELFRIVRSFYRTFIRRTGMMRVCDLGCGDGVISEQLCLEDQPLEAVLVDGSSEMLAAARKRLAKQERLSFVQQSFDAWMDSAEGAPFDFIVSAFAIHHLVLADKVRLFESAWRRLRAGGWFLNIDTVLPDEPELTDWYYAAWQEWVDQHDRHFQLQGQFSGIAEKARRNPDNKLSPLEAQLECLRAAGFRKVMCPYKNGLFAIFAGQRLGPLGVAN